MAAQVEKTAGSAVNSASHLKRRLRSLQWIVWAQRGMRMFLRAAWLGATGVLAVWAIGEIMGKPADAAVLIIAGALAAVGPILLIAFRWPEKNQFTWLLDRRLMMREQISTAWQSIHSEEQNGVVVELVEDVLNILHGLEKRLLRSGWFLWRDLSSLVIAGLLLFLVFGMNATFEASLPSILPVDLIPAGSDPRADDIFPDGVSALPTLTPEAESNNDPGQEKGQSSENSNQQKPLSAAEMSQLHSAMKRMGEMLSQSAVTHEPSQALQRNDLTEAAEAIQSLSDNLDSFSNENKSSISEAMHRAADQLRSENLEKLQNEMKEAADRIESLMAVPEGQQDNLQSLLTKEQMDQVANTIKEIEEQTQGNAPSGSAGSESGLGTGGGAGPLLSPSQQEKNDAQEIERIENEGDEIEFSALGSDDQHLLVPAENPTKDMQPGEQVQGNVSEITTTPDQGSSTNWITPYSFPMKWRNVVSKYFQR
jgi:hypothetical protein